ncbi:hypothetical protein HC891_19620 [Candidatus Gracilibacteria bacterium]|nr:hypothetical protein [Candidatus Gracilibacteria bacterium]
MPNDLENSIRSAAEKAARYVENAAQLRVETRYVDVVKGDVADFAAARPAAKTEINLDGDSFAVIPVRLVDDGMEADRTLLEIHDRNVQTAIEYRARILSSLIGLLMPGRVR